MIARSDLEKQLENAWINLQFFQRQNDDVTDRFSASRIGKNLWKQKILELQAQIEGLDLLQPLFNALQSDFTGNRLKAIDTLGKLKDERAVESLTEVMNSGEESLAYAAAYALAEIQTEEAMNLLVLALDNPGLEFPATTALVKIGKPAIPVLLKHLKGPVHYSGFFYRNIPSEVLVDLLGNLDEDDLFEALDDYELQRFAIDVVARFKIVSLIWKLVEILNNVSTFNEYEETITKVFIQMGEAVVPELLSNLNEWLEFDTIAAIINALGEICDPRAVDYLISSLDSEADIVTEAAIIALQKIKDERAIGPLIEELGDTYHGVQYCALEALDSFGTSAVEGLINAIKSDYVEKAKFAIMTLGKIGDKRALPELELITLNSSNPTMRDAALAAIKDIRQGE